MDWFTHKNKIINILNFLAILSGVLCTIVSLLYFLIVVHPVAYFSGYVVGHYSLLYYDVRYVHNGESISMIHADYVKYVSLAFATISALLSIISIISTIFIARKKSLKALGIVFGVANSLIVSFGLLSGYLENVIELDIDRFNNLVTDGDMLILETSAGLIIYRDVDIYFTPFYRIFIDNQLAIYITILVSLTLSGTILTYNLITKHLQTPHQQKTLPQSSKLVFRKKYVAMLSTTIIVLSFISLASVHVYYPLNMRIILSPPPATLSLPPYTYTCVSISRSSRGAAIYTDFETTPGWSSSGGSWSIASQQGYKGNALSGTDDNQGIGLGSHYYTTISRDSNWVSLKTRSPTGGEAYRGIVLINSALTMFYEISIYSNNLNIWSFYYGSWSRHAFATITGYSASAWYTIVIRYTYSTSPLSVSIEAYVYDVRGTLVASTSARITGVRVFRPAYVGATTDFTGTGAAPQILFDDFIVSTVDPRTIVFSGLQTNMIVEIVDNLGSTVARGSGTGSITLSIVSDVVVGTGVNGRMFLMYPDNYLCGWYMVPTSDAILGGDSYSLSTRTISVGLGVNYTSAVVDVYLSAINIFNSSTRLLTISTTRTLHARLILDSYTIPTTLTASIWIHGAVESSRIIIRNGLVLTPNTNIIQLNIGSNNFITLSGFFTASAQRADLNMWLEICTDSSAGVCVRYPLTLTLRST